MSASRSIKGVLGNFLGTYLSRNSDHEGYWLFGFLVPGLEALRLDLLCPSTDERPAFQYAIDLAEGRFREQLRRSRVNLEEVSAAELTLSRLPEKVPIEVNGCAGVGWEVVAVVSAESKRGHRFEARRRIRVARHDAAVEFKSTRAS